MTDDEIVELAKKAGFAYPHNDCLLIPFARLVLEAEREACASIAEIPQMSQSDIARVIRQRT
jgi:hypothetical protein